jgi:hypothetical protein
VPRAVPIDTGEVLRSLSDLLDAGAPRRALGPDLGAALAQVVKRGGEVEKNGSG